MATEKKKMLAGELYQASDPELATLRQRARQLTRAFNQTTEEEGLRREPLPGHAVVDLKAHCPSPDGFTRGSGA